MVYLLFNSVNYVDWAVNTNVLCITQTIELNTLNMGEEI